jgi:lipoprotein NlpD
MHIINWLKFFRVLLISLVAGLSTSCVKVLDSGWDPQAYSVKKGDTLYSIAWRYEKDFRDIAKWNGIKAPFHIYPGQRLSMVAANASGTIDDQDKPVIEEDDQFDVPAVTVGGLDDEPDIKPVPLKSRVTQRPETIVVRKGDTLYSIARYQNLDHKQLARWNFLSAPYAIYPGKTLKLRPPATSHAVKSRDNKPQSQQASSTKKPVSHKKPGVVTFSSLKKGLPKKVKRWHWPAVGKLVKTFNAKDTNRKGIGIAGNRGQSIKAAAGGRVVYSGNGLIHYGNLVIIKHSNKFLSAYAHNRSLLVKEGDQVKAGQSIAQMGTIESGRARLHFEIRKSGKPVNPLRYLPKRKS